MMLLVYELHSGSVVWGRVRNEETGKDVPCPDGFVQDGVAVDYILGGPNLGRGNLADDALALALRHGCVPRVAEVLRAGVCWVA